MITLARAISLAVEAHGTTLDRGGQPYLLHPLRVMLAQPTIEGQIVGVFHDVMEDVPGWDVLRLREKGFTEPMVEALVALTKRVDEVGSDEGYMRFVKRAGANVIARRVKRVDLRDNLRRERIAAPTPADERRWKRYEHALEYLDTLPD